MDNKYTDAGNQLENYKTKNKLVFSYENKLYCLCGDRGFVAETLPNSHWQSFTITDRDWWSYSKPVIYNNCAYFIKYFVRNLWKLDLGTFEMTEFLLQDIQMA